MIRLRQFGFSQHQTFMRAVKNINVPGLAKVDDAVAGFFDPRAETNPVKHHLRISERDAVFILRTVGSADPGLDGDPSGISSDAYADRSLGIDR